VAITIGYYGCMTLEAPSKKVWNSKNKSLQNLKILMVFGKKYVLVKLNRFDKLN